MPIYKEVKKWVAPHMRTINGKKVRVRGYYINVKILIPSKTQNNWKLDYKGMESPGWYNIKYYNKINGNHIILANCGKHEGTNIANDKWGFGLYKKNDDLILSKTFPSKAKAMSYAQKYMIDGVN